MQPKRREEPEFHPNRQADDGETKNKDAGDGWPVAGIVSEELQTAHRAAVGDLKDAVEQASPPAPGASPEKPPPDNRSDAAFGGLLVRLSGHDGRKPR